jgi:nucleotide-binding universal stress UspA family protein
MFRTIVVPLDGSPFAERALPWALRLARRAGATLELVRGHVLYALTQPAAAWAPFDPAAEADSKQEERAYLDAIARRLAGAAPVSISKTLVDGLESEGILGRVREGRADLVVMATHGRGPLGRFFLGSVADVLVRETSVPVLLVRPRDGAPGLLSGPAAESVLVPLDGSSLAEQALGPAADLARLAGARCTLLRVMAPRQPALEEVPYAGALAYLEAVAGRLREQGLSVQTRVAVAARPARAILNEAREGRVIALATHGRGGVPRVVLGSVADKVVRTAPGPVLVYRPPVGRPDDRVTG